MQVSFFVFVTISASGYTYWCLAYKALSYYHFDICLQIIYLLLSIIIIIINIYKELTKIFATTQLTQSASRNNHCSAL